MINFDDRILDVYDEKELKLLFVIAKRMGQDRKAWPGLKTLMKETKWSKNTVLSVKRRLQLKEAILSEERFRLNGSQASNEYQVTAEGIGVFIPLNQIHQIPIEGGSNFEPPAGQNLNAGGSNSEPPEGSDSEPLEKVKHKNHFKQKDFCIPSEDSVMECFSGKLNALRGVRGPEFWAQWEAKKFTDYYTGTNWRVGKVKMKDWKRAVNGWIQRAMERRTYLTPCPNDPEYLNNGNRNETQQTKAGVNGFNKMDTAIAGAFIRAAYGNQADGAEEGAGIFKPNN